MRESIGGSWLLGLMVMFILLFTAFLVVTINYTKAQRLKNEVTDFIEREEGLTSRTSTNIGAVELIDNYLKRSGQSGMGKCPDNSYIGGTVEGSPKIERALKNKKYHYCVKKIDKFQDKEKQKAYYDVIVFVEFNLPVIGDIFTYSVSGRTAQIQYPADCRTWVSVPGSLKC